MHCKEVLIDVDHDKQIVLKTLKTLKARGYLLNLLVTNQFNELTVIEGACEHNNSIKLSLAITSIQCINMINK